MRATKFYPRLIRFLRPHGWRMAGNIIFNVIGAALDGYSFALLIPFLNALFNQPPLVVGRGWVNNFLQLHDRCAARRGPSDGVAAQCDRRHARRRGGQEHVHLARRRTRRGAAGNVTRDLRDAVFRHMQHCRIRCFTQHQGRADHVPHSQRHGTDQGDRHRGRDARGEFGLARHRVHRVSPGHFVAAHAHLARDRAATHTRAAAAAASAASRLSACCATITAR